MRITQRSMYTNMMGSMQSTLSDYMESITQGASQKRLNRPSDDPAGAARVLTFRASLTRNNQHINNTDTAKGWLNQGIGALTQVESILQTIKGKALDAASGDMSAEQRLIVAGEIREYLGSLMNLSNVTHGGKYIFAGEQYDNPPFREGLAADLHNPGKLDGATSPNLADPPMQITGTLSRTAMVRFSRDGTIPPMPGEEPMEYQWSEDGGKTWNIGTIKEDQNYFDVGSARVTIPTTPPNENNTMSVVGGYQLTPGDPTATPPVPDTRSDPMKYELGSTLKIRPTMIYQGSDSDATANVSRYGVIPLSPSIRFDAVGNFSNDILVRFDSEVEMTDEMLRAKPATTFPYSYSADGGITWISGNSASVTQTFDPTKPPVVTESGFGADLTVKSTVTGGDALVRVTNTPPVDLNAAPPVPLEYQYSTDGGKTWATGTPVPPAEVFDPPTVAPGAGFPSDVKITSGNLQANANLDFTDNPPVAIADGATVNVSVDGGAPVPMTFAKNAKGDLVGTVPGSDITMTLPAGKTASLGNNQTVSFTSNSHTEAALPVAGGHIKITAATNATPPNSVINTGATVGTEAQGGSVARLVLPGGFLDVKIGDRTSGDTTIPQGAQISLQPQRSHLDFEILEEQFLSVNNIGKDIFGGLYTPKNGNGHLEMAGGPSNKSNLFETIGRLIAACETDDQNAVSAALPELDDVLKNVLYHDTALGGKKNRLDVTLLVLDDQKINISERMSAVEDVDFTELMTKLTQQQTAYNTVLKSSSMIMQMNLMKYM